MFVGFIHVHDILNRMGIIHDVCLKFCDNPSLFTGRSIQPFVQVFALLILEELLISVIVKKHVKEYLLNVLR